MRESGSGLRGEEGVKRKNGKGFFWWKKGVWVIICETEKFPENKKIKNSYAAFCSNSTGTTFYDDTQVKVRNVMGTQGRDLQVRMSQNMSLD